MEIKIIKTELNTEIKKAQGGTYRGHNVVYEDGGQVRNKGFHESILENNQDLKSKIESLEDGGWYSVQLEKVEKNGRTFWNWVDITPSSETQNNRPNKSSGNSNNYQGNNTGVAVGHALHCASRLLAGNDFDAETLKKAAYMVYNVSKEMQTEIDTPEF